MLRFSVVDQGLQPDNDGEQAQVARIKSALLQMGCSVRDSYGYVIDDAFRAALNSCLGTAFADVRAVQANLDSIELLIQEKLTPREEPWWKSIWVTVAGGVAVTVITGWILGKR